MAPAPDDSAGAYRAGITAAPAADTANNKNTRGAPQQAVVNGWTAKDLPTVIAQEGSSKEPRDERPAALLVLLIIGLGVGLATSRPEHAGLAHQAPRAADETLPMSVWRSA